MSLPCAFSVNSAVARRTVFYRIEATLVACHFGAGDGSDLQRRHITRRYAGGGETHNETHPACAAISRPLGRFVGRHGG
jgi:hypothetical protein